MKFLIIDFAANFVIAFIIISFFAEDVWRWQVFVAAIAGGVAGTLVSSLTRKLH